MRVGLVDDSGLFREALTTVLVGLGHEVVAAVGDPRQLLARLDSLDGLDGSDDCEGCEGLGGLDVALLDIRLPPTFTTEGLDLACRLRAAHPGLGVLVLSTYAEAGYVIRLLEACPSHVGYLLKDRVGGGVDLDAAMRRVHAGEVVVDPVLVRALVQRHSPGLLATLTTRELEVLALLAQGRSNAGISGELFLATKTVERHVATIFDKLGLQASGADNRRVRAALMWMRSGTPGV